MPSGQTIITNALIKLGIVPQGGAPSASDSAIGLAELNNAWDAWSIDEGLIFSVLSISKALTAATASYTIGVGATFNVPRPTRIYKAFISGTNRSELKVVDAMQYYSHNDLAAAAVTPDELYPDFNVDPTTGYAKIYLWPVNSGTPTLEIEVGVPFTAWTLAGVVLLPPAFQDMLEWALAYRLIPGYGGIVAPQVVQTCAAEAEKAELRIRAMNSRNRQVPIDQMMLPGQGQPAPVRQQ